METEKNEKGAEQDEGARGDQEGYIAAVLDDAPVAGGKSEPPADKEPKGPSSDDVKDAASSGKAAEVGDAEGTAFVTDTEPSKEAKGEKAEGDGKPADGKEPEPEFEIAGRDGVRKVKLSQLTTTYQQYAHLQSRHEALKPILDLAKESGIPVNQIFNYLVYGIQAAHEASQRKTSAVPSSSEGKSGAYSGPFDSQEQEEAVKDSDPVLYRSVKAMWEQNQSLSNLVAQLQGRLDSLAKPVSQAGASAPADGAGRDPEVAKRINNLLDEHYAAHKDYYAKFPERREHFKGYLAHRFGATDVSQVDANLLNVAFQLYDPAYYATWQEARLKESLANKAERSRKGFGESGSMRSSAPSGDRDEQQRYMAAILAED